jgi:tetratricopeptide (TPR) repeat protein
MLTVMATPGWIDRRAARLGLFAAAAMLLVHNQIEMTFFTDGAALLAMLIIGSAAAKGGDMAEPRHAIVAPVAMFAIAGAMALWCAAPITRQQAALGRAEATLREVADARNQRRADMERQLRQGGDPPALFAAETVKWSRETARVREQLAVAHDALPIDAAPIYWQVRLLFEDAMVFRQMRQTQEAEQVAFDALTVMDQSAPPDDLTAMRLRARVFEFLADLLDAPDWRRDAAAIWSRVIARSPYSLRDHLHLADLYWQMADRDRAIALYEQCLTLHEQAYLDPATQLDEQTLRQVQSRAQR